MSYRVFNMEMRHFKEPLWLHFWWQTFFSIILIVEKCVHFDIWNKKIPKLSKGPPMIWLIIQNLDLAENFKNEPNHRGDPLNFLKNFLFQISKCTHFSTIRMMEKNVCHQKWSLSSSLKCLISILNTLYILILIYDYDRYYNK